MTAYCRSSVTSSEAEEADGSCNVQAVLEKLGNGGGNGATAGAQIKGKPLQEVLKELIAAIDAFYS